ncbi:cornifelin homolog A-like [Bombina bombina]|uniref:cornifelin homolog A-like n=1 Tax=Bombina bombina TaxID=8345 RepID=UPI00235AB98F|nr:cornifelin homolog A-like [Bombina bombina]
MAYPITNQPQGIQGMNVDSSKSTWGTEVTECCDDMGICLCGTFVPCILACRVAADFGECCCLPFIGGGVLAMRTGIRERYRIPGTICDDCICLTFCYPCAICQMARELDMRK